MPAAFDAACTISTSANGTSAQSLITVGSGTNRALVVMLQFVGTSLPAALVVTWDSAGTGGAAQPMTQITNTFVANTANCCVLYGLVAPNSGLRLLSVAYTGTTEVGIYAVSFTGADQTGGATTFANGNHNSGVASNPATVTITSTSADAICACFVDNNTQGSATLSDTQIDGFRSGNSEDCCANYAIGSGTHALTATWPGACNWASAGTSIKAVATGSVSAATGTGAALAVGAALGLTFLSPDADASAGGWTNESGGTTLYPSIDERFTPNDADYIRSSNNPSNDTCRVSLSNPSGAVAQPFTVSYRYGKSGTAQIDITVTLRQGSTTIASWTHTNVSA